MPKLTSVLARNVLSKADCRIIGFIQDAYFDVYCKNLAYFVCRKGEETFALPFSAVVAVADAVVVNDEIAKVSLSDLDVTSYATLVYGKELFDGGGNSKGTVSDVLYDNKGKVLCLYTGETEYTPGKLSGVGDVILIKEGAKPRAKRTHKPLIPAAKTDALVSVLAIKEGAVPIPLADGKKHIELAVKSEHTPPRIISDYNFLLGRTLTHDLISYTGAVLASKNTFVTAETVELARTHGKLVDLTLNSK